MDDFFVEKVLYEREGLNISKAISLNDKKHYSLINIKKSTISMVGTANSPFVMKVFSMFQTGVNVCIVSEFPKLGSLSEFIERRKKERKFLNENDIWRILIQVLLGMKIISDSCSSFSSIASNNIWIKAPDLVCICPSRLSPMKSNSNELIQRNEAPETILNNIINEKTLIWNAGVILFELMTFCLPFIGKSINESEEKILNGDMNPIRGNYSAELNNIARLLLKDDPNSRPSIEEVLFMRSIQNRMSFVKGFFETNNRAPLSVLKENTDPNNCHLKAMGRRIKVNAISIHKPIDHINTSELKMIIDNDWWKSANSEENDEFDMCPETTRSNNSCYTRKQFQSFETTFKKNQRGLHFAQINEINQKMG